MRFRTVDALARGDSSSLGQRQRGLVAFADKLTRSPQTFGAVDTAALVDALGDEGDALEAATVVAGFNFANRVADALAVPREFPDAFDRWPLLRGLAMRLMS